MFVGVLEVVDEALPLCWGHEDAGVDVELLSDGLPEDFFVYTAIFELVLVLVEDGEGFAHDFVGFGVVPVGMTVLVFRNGQRLGNGFGWDFTWTG